MPWWHGTMNPNSSYLCPIVGNKTNYMFSLISILKIDLFFLYWLHMLNIKIRETFSIGIWWWNIKFEYQRITIIHKLLNCIKLIKSPTQGIARICLSFNLFLVERKEIDISLVAFISIFFILIYWLSSNNWALKYSCIPLFK